MPKLLRLNISSKKCIISVGLLLLSCIFMKLYTGDNKICTFFYGINYAMWMLSGVWKSEMLHFSLPDYIFVAPYSEDERRSVTKQAFKSYMKGMYLWLFIVLILPSMIYSVITQNIGSVLICFVEMMILFSYVIYGSYYFYLEKIYALSDSFVFILYFVLQLLVWLIFSKITVEKDLHHIGNLQELRQIILGNKSDFVVMGVIIVISIVLPIVYYKKYYENLIYYCANYELSRQIKKDNKQKKYSN